MKGASDDALRSDETVDAVITVLKDLNLKLRESEIKMLIHCSAGVHRTGFVAYLLLRMNGLESEQAFEKLKEMREETYLNVNTGLNRI
jgi:protein tyrosine/serine phosphatase